MFKDLHYPDNSETWASPAKDSSWGEDRRRRSFAIIDNRAILLCPRIGAAGLAVYACLVMHARQRDSTYPGIHKLARELGLDSKTIRRALQRLADSGLLSIEARRDSSTGRQTSNRYVLLDPPKNGRGDPPKNGRGILEQEAEGSSSKQEAKPEPTEQPPVEAPAFAAAAELNIEQKAAAESLAAQGIGSQAAESAARSYSADHIRRTIQRFTARLASGRRRLDNPAGLLLTMLRDDPAVVPDVKGGAGQWADPEWAAQLSERNRKEREQRMQRPQRTSPIFAARKGEENPCRN